MWENQIEWYDSNWKYYTSRFNEVNNTIIVFFPYTENQKIDNCIFKNLYLGEYYIDYWKELLFQFSNIKLEFIPTNLWVEDINLIWYKQNKELKKIFENQLKKESIIVATLNEIITNTLKEIVELTNNNIFHIDFLLKMIWKVVIDKNFRLSNNFYLKEIIKSIKLQLLELEKEWIIERMWNNKYLINEY